MKNIKSEHEWDLAGMHKKALLNQDYELCQKIQSEINNRIADNTINHGLMDGFRSYNEQTGTHEGEMIAEGLNGLFDNYDYEIAD